MHSIVNAESNAMEVDGIDPFSWIDIREVIHRTLIIKSKSLISESWNIWSQTYCRLRLTISCGKVDKSQSLILPTNLQLQLKEHLSDNIDTHSQWNSNGFGRNLTSETLGFNAGQCWEWPRPSFAFCFEIFSYLYNHITQDFFLGVVSWN